ncbi:MAG: FtsX-like permease family protein [Candidatus Hodarchaeales archaeon]|jgi:ABC-type antimicrobial peptide transport system permease subunit
MTPLGVMKEKIRIIIQLLRINVPISLITLIGLTIALSISAASLIYLDSNKTEVYMSIYDNKDFKKNLSFIVNRHDLSSEIFKNYSEIITIQESLNKKLEDHNLGNVFTQNLYSPYYMVEDPTYFIGIDLDNKILEDCIEGSSLPSHSNETIVFNPHYTNMSIGDVFNVTYTELIQEGYRFEINYTMEITGIITPSTLKEDSPLLNVFPEYYFDFLPIIDFTDITSILDSIEKELEIEIFEEINRNRSEQIFTRIYFSYTLNMSNIRPSNVVEVIENYFSFLKKTGYNFELDGVELENPGYSPNAKIVQKIITNFNSSFFLFLILIIPTFILTFLLIKFSLNLINTQRKKSIALCKMRALSNNFILISLVIEIVIVSLMGSVTGIIVGIPLFLLMTTTTGFLSFELTEIPSHLVLSPSTVQITFFMSLILTFLSQFRQILSLSRAKIILFRQELSTKKKQRYGRFRGNLDIFLLIQGGIGIVFLTWLTESSLQNDGIFGNLIFLILILVILSPLVFLIGIILTLHRFIPIVIHHSGIFFWKKNWQQLALAIRNLSINMRLSERTTLIIAVSLSFLMILSSLPTSLYNYHIDNTYYGTGYDWVIYSPTIERNWDIITPLSAIPGINITQVGYRWGGVSYLGIEENFAQIAHWQDYYDDSSLEELVLSLFSSSADFPAIVSSRFANQEKLSIGDSFRGLEEKELTIEGISNYWPGTESDFIITTLISLENMTEHTDYYIWLKFLEGHNQTYLITEARKIFESAFSDPFSEPVKEKLGDRDTTNPSNAFIWVIINFNFFASLTVAISVIILFSFTRIVSNAPEIGLSRALGMKYKQLFLLTFIEPFFLFFISGIPGAIIGVTLLYSFILIMEPFLIQEGPPLILNLNYPVIILIYSMIFIITLIVAALSSFIITRVKISRILQAE